ncbi:MAG: hypothetical protein OXL96_17260 [Candidatus Poribacteria bacterium]|nr:hypothetical protein [Candidatus Poribacteria bacterium]
MSMYEMRVIDLKGLSVNNFIEFLRMEILNVHGYGPTFFGRVRYALNGVEQEEGLPMDLSKGIFIATLRDDQLGDIPREKLEKTLQKASGEIIDIVRKALSRKEFLLNDDYIGHDDDCSVGELGEISESILENILEDYPYLEYDKSFSKPPDVLKCRVTKPKSPRDVEDIFQIFDRLRIATGESYIVTYGGSSSTGDNLDEVWTRFSLRKFDSQKVKSK